MKVHRSPLLFLFLINCLHSPGTTFTATNAWVNNNNLDSSSYNRHSVLPTAIGQRPYPSTAKTATSTISSSSSSSSTRHLLAVPGADIDQPPVVDVGSSASSSSRRSDAASDLSTMPRGKVNEIDFCIAPADVSLSRAYGAVAASSESSSSQQQQKTTEALSSPPVLSLTRALNNASNRAVRRILLAGSWPSAEALNLSLRRAAAAEKKREEGGITGGGGDDESSTAAAARSAGEGEVKESSAAKCPVPRPILNVLTRRRRQKAQAKGSDGGESIDNSRSGDSEAPVPRSRTDEEYVADQIKAFRGRYGDLPGYEYAEAYLEAVLSLATAGIESEGAAENVIKAGVYDESYKRVIAVLRSVGVVFERDPETGRLKVGKKMLDQDICLSVMDKLRMRKEKDVKAIVASENSEAVSSKEEEKKQTDVDELTKEDLGGVLLSAEEPSVTRQLNALSNIVQRALLFGGDQELLVLADTLYADRKAFVDRWYPNTGGIPEDARDEDETRPGAQFFNCLVRLLRECYDNGVVVSLEPPLPLSQSYANSYERLVARAVELGSGYLKPVPSDVMTMPKPRTAQEELGRFAVWESAFRQTSADVSAYPEDLEGIWEVQDEIGGETIGTSLVTFLENGAVEVAPPLEGLRWRLDPGPTHLDTCTFQVLSSDGTILQYRGFIDRGARLESRFSKRPIRIRGSVMFQMRDGSIDYYKDMLPINYRTGTTKFVMAKQTDDNR